VSVHLVVPLASPGPLAGVIDLFGFLAVVAWIGWRFGPTLARVTGRGWWWAAWACGSVRHEALHDREEVRDLFCWPVAAGW